MKFARKLLTLFLMSVLVAGIAYAGGKKEAKPDELDAAVRDTSNYLNSTIPAGNKIVILNIQSDTPALSDYIIDELIANAVNDKIFSVVDRHQLDAIRAEQNFQLSGEVADNHALEIGKFFGAQTIVSGAIGPLAGGHRLRVRALNVETAVVQGQFNRNITTSHLVTSIIAESKTATTARPAASAAGVQTSAAPTTSPAQAATPAAPTQPAAPVAYKIGDKGPAGGIIFYDKRNNSGGWRYLEAAPAETEFKAKWTIKRTVPANLQEAIGSGKKNTQIIVETFENTSGEWDTVAQKCVELVIGGFNDWFIPSKDELDQMYGQLKRRNLGDFRDERYVTSNPYYFNGDSALTQDFKNGEQGRQWFGEDVLVRPIRQVAGQ